jgi:hypothetical protein
MLSIILFNDIGGIWFAPAALPPIAYLDKAFATITVKQHYKDMKASKPNKNKVSIPSLIDTGDLELLTCNVADLKNQKF